MKMNPIIQRAADLQEKVSGTVDGHPRNKKADDEISASVARVLATGDGKVMYEWMRQITVNKVLGSNASASELAYQEGMRMMVALISLREIDHKSNLSKSQASK